MNVWATVSEPEANETVTATETELITSGAGAGYGYVQASMSVGSTVTPGYYNFVVTDNNGATAALVPGLLVTAAPVVTAVSPTTIYNGSGQQTVTLTGTGFESGMTATFTNASDGTTLKDTTGTPYNNGVVTFVSATSATISVTPTNSAVSGSSANSGSYTVSVTNPDGGTSTSTTGLLTVAGPTITAVTPSWISNASTSTVNVVITGTDLQSLAAVSLTTATAGSPTLPSLGIPQYTSSTSITVPVTVGVGNVNQIDSITITNPANGGSTTLAGAIGIGTLAPTAAQSAPTITAATNFTVAPSTTGNLVLTGTNFVPGQTDYNDVVFYPGTSTTAETGLTCSSISVPSTTQMDCAVAVVGSTSQTTPTLFGGPASVTVNFGGATTSVSNQFAGALTVAGPTITSISPAVYAQSAAMGTVTITGTGFTQGASTAASSYDFTFTGATGTALVNYVSSTELQVTGLTASATSGTTYVMTLTQSGAAAQGTFSVGNNPTISSVSYAASTIGGVRVGATNAAVTINGSGFLPGATVAFANSLVSGTVSSVAYNAIVLAVSISSTDTATGASSFTVSNTNGGSVSGSFTIDAAPLTGAKISGNSVIAGASAATFTVTGGNLSAKTTVTPSSTLLTLGTPSYNTTTGVYSFTASGPAITGTVPVGLSLAFANPDGGTSTVAFSINPQPTVTGTYYVPTFSTNYEVSVTGTGFEPGMTATSSNSAFTVLVAGVNSTGTVATLLVSTTSAATTGTSSNITLTNADGSTVTFALNGGSAPVVKPPVAFKVFRVYGVAWVGKTVTIKITGTGFYGQPTITSNVAGVKAIVSGDNGKVLTVRVSVAATSHVGVHTFTVRLANGKAATVRYNTK